MAAGARPFLRLPTDSQSEPVIEQPDRPQIPGPLSSGELLSLESTLLPALERHHLRLLAHALRTLQGIAADQQGLPPSRSQLEAWAARQPALAEDSKFAAVFLDQLERAADQLECVASELGTPYLNLSLAELSQWAQAQADARLQKNPSPKSPEASHQQGQNRPPPNRAH